MFNLENWRTTDHEGHQLVAQSIKTIKMSTVITLKRIMKFLPLRDASSALLSGTRCGVLTRRRCASGRERGRELIHFVSNADALYTMIQMLVRNLRRREESGRRRWWTSRKKIVCSSSLNAP